ncbi:putrescine aminopropyltransferase [Fusarium solani]|nr:putrescine aminopropyltransferase [Fusarium solani]
MTLPWSVLRWASKILPASPPGRSGYVQVRRGCELVKKTSLAPFSTLSSPLAVGLIGSSLHYHRRSQLALPISHSLRFFSTMSSEEITHETIKDGWFREISEMWPGQAMTLRVEKVLVHEKSKYQDVLIFKSTDFGNVLVLDNVVQCTERDEFSYQEMITHLAMNSHPNPKKVLVIGGGDGGVLREIVKHDCVEEAILCDIDEAVVRLSKQYLPTMSVGFDHPKVKVHIGDGFKFLNDYKNEFDVIITDSSDPEGPAEALFEKNYFKLLHDALKEGGVISTQGCMFPIFLREVTGVTRNGRIGEPSTVKVDWCAWALPRLAHHGATPDLATTRSQCCFSSSASGSPALACIFRSCFYACRVLLFLPRYLLHCTVVHDGTTLTQLTLLQPRTSGFTCLSSPSSRRTAAPSSPSPSTPTPPSPPTPRARSASWSAPRTPTPTSRPLSDSGPRRRRMRSADTTLPRSTRPASSSPSLPRRPSSKVTIYDDRKRETTTIGLGIAYEFNVGNGITGEKPGQGGHLDSWMPGYASQYGKDSGVTASRAHGVMKYRGFQSLT